MEPGPTGDAEDEAPEEMRAAVKSARRRSWQHLANERIDNTKPIIPLGKRFWPLATEERSEITRLFEKEHVRQLATVLRSRKDDAPVDMLDAAYWKKGCSSLGKIRYCVLGVGDKPMELCLMDLKEAVQAAAPADDSADMPADQAQRVVEGARHLSPYLGERMRAIQMFGRSIFIRELLPQDLKIELDSLTREEQAMNIAHFLANVVGKAHARQMDEDTRSNWAKELSRARTATLRLLPGCGVALSTCLQFMSRPTWSAVGFTR